MLLFWKKISSILFLWWWVIYIYSAYINIYQGMYYNIKIQKDKKWLQCVYCWIKVYKCVLLYFVNLCIWFSFSKTRTLWYTGTSENKCPISQTELPWWDVKTQTETTKKRNNRQYNRVSEGEANYPLYYYCHLQANINKTTFTKNPNCRICIIKWSNKPTDSL